MDYYVYILQCNDNSYYTGITNDIDRRLAEHNDGQDSRCYTYNRRPCKLVFADEFPTAIEAITVEKQIKGWRRAKKEALIQGDFDTLIGLSKSLNVFSERSQSV